jgi:beta-N-acetylhexosaminidase
VAQEVARRGLTLVKNDGGLLPLRPATTPSLCVVYPHQAMIDQVEIAATVEGEPATLGQAVQALYPAASQVAVGARPTAEEIRRATGCARDARVLVLGTYNLHEYPSLAALMASLVALEKPTVVVALRLPYDLAQLESAPALLAAYSNRPASLRAVAEALAGAGPAPSGHLPVPLSARWPLGYGLLEWSRADRTGGAGP